MLLSVILLLLGLAMVVLGSDFLVDGASNVARKIGISEFVIGIIIVGFGTSLPELVVSVNGALDGSSAIALGNVVGSNTLNILLILGLTAIIMPISVTDENKKRDFPILIAVTAFFILMSLNGFISRFDAAAFLIIFTVYIVYNLKQGKEDVSESDSHEHKIPLSILMIIGGLAGLIVGGKLFVNNAVTIAHALGASEKFIAVTVLALGTSLPELVTCVVAAAKKKGQLALGNIVGSNVFNILLILGVSGLIRPLDTTSLDYVDMGVMFLSALLLCIFSIKRQNISRGAGISMLTLEIIYTIYLFIRL